MSPSPDPYKPGQQVKPGPSAQQKLLTKKRAALYQRAITRVEAGGPYTQRTIKRLRAGGYKGAIPQPGSRKLFPGHKLNDVP